MVVDFCYIGTCMVKRSLADWLIQQEEKRIGWKKKRTGRLIEHNKRRRGLVEYNNRRIE